eukprot:EG_transcript_16703
MASCSAHLCAFHPSTIKLATWQFDRHSLMAALLYWTNIFLICTHYIPMTLRLTWPVARNDCFAVTVDFVYQFFLYLFCFFMVWLQTRPLRRGCCPPACWLRWICVTPSACAPFGALDGVPLPSAKEPALSVKVARQPGGMSGQPQSSLPSRTISMYSPSVANGCRACQQTTQNFPWLP